MHWPAPTHGKGDRVMYDGREWRVVYAQWFPHYLTDLIATDGSDERRDSVHMSHLTMSWCPKSHGGSGPPVAAEVS